MQSKNNKYKKLRKSVSKKSYKSTSRENLKNLPGNLKNLENLPRNLKNLENLIDAINQKMETF